MNGLNATDVLLLIQSLYPLQFGARDQDCVLAGTDGDWWTKCCLLSSLMDMEQQVNGDRMETAHRKLDYRISTDDEEVALPPNNRDMEVPDNPDTDIHDRQAMSDTQ